MRYLCILILTGLFSETAFAELPPTAYVKFQADAPEAMQIHVREVRVVGSKPATVTIDADVVSVIRSAANLNPGEVIHIRYETRAGEVIVGPSPIPIPRPDDICPAYLKKVGDGFAPAAGGMTFRTFDLRAYATEKLIIEPRSKALSDDESPQRVTYLATVLTVQQSLSGLAVGDVIQIGYELDSLNPPASLTLHEPYAAFLHKQFNGPRYYLAAGVESFAPAPRPATMTGPATAPAQ